MTPAAATAGVLGLLSSHCEHRALRTSIPGLLTYREATLRLGSDMMSHGPEGGLESSPAPVTHRILSIPGSLVARPATAPGSL